MIDDTASRSSEPHPGIPPDSTLYGRIRPFLAELGGGMPGNDWRGMLQLAGDYVLHLLGDTPALAKLTALYDDITVDGAQIRVRLEDLSNDLARENFEAGVAAGWALAHTWPTKLEDLEAWPRTAFDYAGFADKEQGEATE